MGKACNNLVIFIVFANSGLSICSTISPGPELLKALQFSMPGKNFATVPFISATAAAESSKAFITDLVLYNFLKSLPNKDS